MVKEIVELLVQTGDQKWQADGGLLSWDTFQQSMEDDQVKTYFMMLDLDVASAQKIFKIIDSERIGKIELIDFVQACLSMKGTAKMVDIAVLQMENEKLLTYMREMKRSLHALIHGAYRHSDRLMSHASTCSQGDTT